MSNNLQLRRLLQRKKIQSWLNACSRLDPAYSLALFDNQERQFSRSQNWDDETQGGEGEFDYPLALSGSEIGRLVIRGGSADTRRRLMDLAGKTLDIWLGEALESRGLAKEALDRYREINLLYRVGETIGATLDPDAILNMLLEESHQVIDADFRLVLLKIPDRGWDVAVSNAAVGIVQDPGPYKSFVSGRENAQLEPSIITEFDDFLGETAFEDVGSLLWAPLKLPEKILGGIFLGRGNGQPVFDANDQNLLVTLTIQAAVALEKATLFEEAKTNTRHLQELNRIGITLAGTLDLQPLLERIMEAAISLTSAERGSLFLIEDETREIVFSVVSEKEDQILVGKRLPMGAGIVGKVAETGESMIVNRVEENESFFAGIDSTTGYVTHAILAVPMMKDGQVVGVIEVLNRKDGRPFQEQDIVRLISFSSQAVVAMETARLHQQELAKQRMERELQLGHGMQSSLIPSTVPQMEGWEFAAWWQPAREVSGDYYDFIALDDDVGVVIADVADKGVHAALFMVLSRSTIRTSLRALRQPATSIFEANRLIAEDAPGGMFLTLCYAQFSPESGSVTYVNAGHNPPLWYRADCDEMEELPPTGIFLGMVSDLPYEEKTVECQHGDVLVFYTDGVTEAMNPEREIFGEERFVAAVKAISDRQPKEILRKIKESLAEFIQGATQSDDITLVVAKNTKRRDE